ncbi:single-stranded-DNA-specific exonuclease RecJ [Candidatus Fermentibacterales bacterium]|nr:single-stranded-DNA-specific exonuclease RecJ [Candidatus Fermentibacterales bacterium]
MRECIWHPRPVPRPEVEEPPPGYADLPASLALLLARRGLEAEALAGFLDPTACPGSSWRELGSADRAAARIALAVERGERILVHGDFDADGMTATALVCRLLDHLGADSCYFIPDRIESGYGLGEEGVRAAVDGGCGMLLTVDCGTSALQASDALAGAGVDLVVCDHHESSGDLPVSVAVVNPVLDGAGSPFSVLAGVGVAFKLAEALVEITGCDSSILDRLMELVAIGTICDVVPLTGENRTLVARGLQMLRTRPGTGLQSLARIAGIDLGSIGGSDIAFGLGPRLNACGRVGDADWGVELLLTDDESRASELSSLIDRNNQLRKDLDRLVHSEASRLAADQADRKTLVLCSDRWHQGVLGIAASRLAREYGRPAVLISLESEPAKGSARSIEGFEVHSALSAVSDLLETFGGHPQAAGLSIRRDNIPAFSERFELYAAEAIGDEPLHPILYYDGALAGPDYTLDTVRQLGRLEPFGEGNREPVWIACAAKVLDVGTMGSGRHLRARFSVDGRRVDAVGFGMGDRAGDLRGLVDIAFVLSENRYGGNPSLQLILRDFRDPGAVEASRERA